MRMQYEDFFEPQPPRRPRDPQLVALIGVLVTIAVFATCWAGR
ncbi:MAG TPA: hypothetical protein VN706_05315 [Gemmatimonadaceae bacterium]|nr:hypothetical protein [Gemmatimonadaceae bacterium]